AVTECCLRDRGVCVSSEDALIQSRNEGGEDLALANAPRRRAPHHLLGQLGERLTKEFLSIEECAHDARRVTHHQPHHREDCLLAEPMSAMNFLKPHASFSARSPACSR